jgi:hypothetical protein
MYDPFDEQIYMGGKFFFAKFDPDNNTIQHLNIVGRTFNITNLTYNPKNKYIYIAADQTFSSYNPFTETMHVLTEWSPYISTVLDNKTNTIYYSAVNFITGTSSIGQFYIDNNNTVDLSPSINKALGHNNFGGEMGINKFCYDDKNDTIYFSYDKSDFISNISSGLPYLAQYNLHGITATSMAGLFNGAVPKITSLLCLSSEQKVFLGTNDGGFLVYDTSLSKLSDLTNSISSFWGANPISAMAFIPQTGEILLGGGSQRFAKYNIYNKLSTDLTSIISPYFGNSNYAISSLAYVPDTNDLYIGGGEKSVASYDLRFIKYNITNNGVVDLTSDISNVLNHGVINNIMYNPVTQKLYITANQYSNCSIFQTCSDINGKITEYDLSSSTVRDLTLLLPDWNLSNAINSVAVNNVNGALYVGGDGESLALIDPIRNTSQDLSYYMPYDYADDAFGKLPITALLYLPETDSLFIGGDLRKFIEYKDQAFIVSKTINTLRKDIKEATFSYRDNGNVDYYLSNNGGHSWYKVSENEKFIFPTESSDLRWKIFIKDKDSYTNSITIHYKYATNKTKHERP